MSNAIDIIIKIFALLGFVGLIGVSLYYIAKEIQKYKPPEEQTWPDQYSMEKLGARCPTGWVYKGDDDLGRNICQNKYNIDVPKSQRCYNRSISQKTSHFNKIKNWKECQDNPGKCLQKRCNWVKKCGPKAQQNNPNMCGDEGLENDRRAYASWIGVADKC